MIGVLSDIDENKYLGLNFIKKLITTLPNLFSIETASSFLYSQICGNVYNENVIFSNFSNIMKGNIGKNNYFWLWASYMERHKAIISFELSMEKINKILKVWFESGKKLSLKGRIISLEDFKILCYNLEGVSIYQNLPYLIYIITFLTYGHPYSFNEATVQSSCFGFLTSFDQHLMKGIRELNSYLGIDVLSSSLIDIENFTSQQTQQLRKLLDIYLKPETVIKIRNKEIEKEQDLLEECVTDQNDLSNEYLTDSFHLVLNNVVNILLDSNPYSSLSKMMPLPDVNKYDVEMLGILIKGKNHNLLIDNMQNIDGITDFTSELLIYKFNDNNPSTIYDSFFAEEIKINNMASNQVNNEECPFLINSFISRLFTGYFTKRFKEIQLNNLLLDEEELVYKNNLIINGNISIPSDFSFYQEFKNFYIRGVWNKSKSVLVSIFESHPNIVAQIKETEEALRFLLNHESSMSYQLLFSEIFILSYIPIFLNRYVNNLSNFSVIRSINEIILSKNLNHGYIDQLTYLINEFHILSNPIFNKCLKIINHEFQLLINSSPSIYSVWIAKNNLPIDVERAYEMYAIGGIELSNALKDPNPLVRSCLFYEANFGTNDKLHTFLKIMRFIKNESFYSTLYDVASKEDKTLMHELTKIALKKVTIKQNYLEFDLAHIDKLLELEINGENVIEMLSKLFTPSSILSTNNLVFKSKQIVIENGEVTKVHATRSGLLGDSTTSSSQSEDKAVNVYINPGGQQYQLPILDYNGKIDNICLTFSPFKSLRHLSIPIHRTNNYDNEIIWLFTTIRESSSFDMMSE
jgi:hypothetical protein